MAVKEISSYLNGYSKIVFFGYLFLKERGLLFDTEMYTHSYPHCWRCKTPLLYYPKETWFIKTTAVKDQMIANNKKINWIPWFTSCH